MNYTRRRALLACDFCRHRKRKCDGERPCSTCRDSNADCVYKELPADSPAFSPAQRSRSSPLLYQNPPGYPEPPRLSENDPQDMHQFLIPTGVSLTSDLFSVPGVQEQLQGYPRNVFFAIEQSNIFPSATDSLNSAHPIRPTLTENVANELANSYFLHVHPHQPLFSPGVFSVWQRKGIQDVPNYDIEAAICLCVYTLGTIATHAHNPGDEENESTLGLLFFKPALQVILHDYTWSFQPDLRTCQALLLASTCFGYLGRPLQCWKMAYLSARMFLDYLDTNHTAELDITRSGIEPLGDRIPLPRSMDMESMSDANDTVGFVAEIALRRLLNRVLNSLYSTQDIATVTSDMYFVHPFSSPPRRFSTETASSKWPQQHQQGLSLQKLLALSSELNRQLEQWHDSMPDGLRPPKGVEPIESERGRVLRIRYYEARYIIHRPFVIQAAFSHQQQQQQQQQGFLYPTEPSSPAPAPASASGPAATATAPPAMDVPLIPQVVIDGCGVCIESCIAYLYNVFERLERRSAHLWSLAQNALACVLVLAVAERCPPLRPFMPPTLGVRQIRDTLVARLKRWATSGSSFEADVAILENLRLRGDGDDTGAGETG
ncbi:uncharacterized protein PG998_003685 [Apiospora kogelbergensis]|uniref:uncharacterized protein n=1 Tax=Apiospora kogelbergensis TaxID=1337665 RepID=UPI0031324DEB